MISLPGPLTSKHIQISLQNFQSPALFVTLWTSQCEVTISSFHLQNSLISKSVFAGYGIAGG